MYEVQWLEAAVQELADLWLNSDSSERALLNGVTRLIDDTLRNNPYQKGESRPEGRRIFFALPLGVYFRVERQEPVVLVTHVWRVSKHGWNFASVIRHSSLRAPRRL